MAPTRNPSRFGPPAVLLLALLLGGCAGTGGDIPALAPGPAAATTGAADSTAGAAGCGLAIANFERVINADVESGHLNRSVHTRIVGDLGTAKASCAAGRDAQARAQLASVRARYGYP